MFGNDPSSNGQADDPVLREAARWLARAELGTLDEAAFERWRADPRHALAYARVVDAARRTAAAVAGGAVLPRGRASEVSRRAALIVGLGAMSLGGGVLLAGRVNARSRASTPVGGLRSVDLPSTGALTLNTDSAVSWRSDRRGTRLWLERGEIALDLAGHAPPLRLAGGEGHARLAPGLYNARLRQGLLDLTILRGEARVDEPSDAVIRGPRAVVLTSGGALVRNVSSEDLAATQAWRDGDILFVNTPLAAAVEEYNRHLSRKIVIADPALGDLRVGGRFTATDPSVFLRALELTLGIEVTTSEQSVILLQKRK